ncbi:MAG: Uma2 family endonuclease [Planctomycetota bacterium]|jgi:Uma2 family endonuclease
MQNLAFRSLEPMTQGEFARWLETVPANDLHHYELLDGFIVMEPPAGWPHGEVGGEVFYRIKSYLRRRPLGRAFDSSQGFNLPTGDTVEPDVAFVSVERWSRLARPVRGFPAVVPDLAVEVLSPSTKRIDQEQKKRVYERNGVREYWLVDPVSRSVSVLFLTANGYEEGPSLASGDTLTSRVLPGLRIPVTELFPEE